MYSRYVISPLSKEWPFEVQYDISLVKPMVAYFCHHLSDNYVDLSDLYVDLSLIHLLENESLKHVLAQLMPYR